MIEACICDTCIIRSPRVNLEQLRCKMIQITNNGIQSLFDDAIRMFTRNFMLLLFGENCVEEFNVTKERGIVLFH